MLVKGLFLRTCTGLRKPDHSRPPHGYPDSRNALVPDHTIEHASIEDFVQFDLLLMFVNIRLGLRQIYIILRDGFDLIEPGWIECGCWVDRVLCFATTVVILVCSDNAGYIAFLGHKTVVVGYISSFLFPVVVS
jgi:hypothetical protein